MLEISSSDWILRQLIIKHVKTSTDSLTDETKYLDNVFSKNKYNPDFVKRNAQRLQKQRTQHN